MPKKINKKIRKKIQKKTKKSAKATSASSSAKAKGPRKKTVRKKAARKEPQKKLTKRQAAKKRAEEKVGKASVGTVEAWITQVRKTPKFQGTVQVGLASELNVPYRLRRPSGILSLDIAMGGGFHAGGSAEISGPESVGKTALAYMVAGNVQRNYGQDANIMVVSTEIRLDKTFARKFGFRIPYSEEEVFQFNKIRRAKGLPVFTVGEVADLVLGIGNVVPVTGATGEPALDVALSGLEAGLFQLVIIESLGALLTADQDAGDVADRTYGGSSVMLTNFMNKAYPLFMMDRITETGTGKNKVEHRSMLETTILGINQARATLGATGHQKKTHAAAGAFAWKHAQLLAVELSRGAPIRAVQKGPITGREVKWTIIKGKAGTHDGKTGLYDYHHVPKDDPILWSDVEERSSEWGPDMLTDLAETAKALGVVEVAGGGWTTWRDEDGSVIAKVQGASEFAEVLVNDLELEAKLRQQCLDAADLPVLYR
jgi:RecA/RadA recombinase